MELIDDNDMSELIQLQMDQLKSLHTENATSESKVSEFKPIKLKVVAPNLDKSSGTGNVVTHPIIRQIVPVTTDNVQSEMRPCVDCGNLEISASSPSYMVRCKSCYKVELERQRTKLQTGEFRACVDCGQKNISMDSPKYMVRCKSCYFKTKK